MKKTTADSKYKGKNTGYTRNLHGQSLSGNGCWSSFVTKLALALCVIQVLDGSDELQFC